MMWKYNTSNQRSGLDWLVFPSCHNQGICMDEWCTVILFHPGPRALTIMLPHVRAFHNDSMLLMRDLGSRLCILQAIGVEN